MGSKAEGLLVPCLPHCQGCDGKGLGTALAGPWQCSPVCLGTGSAGSVLCPSLQNVPSVPGWMGEPRRCQWSCSQLSLQPRLLQGCLWKGTVGQAQGPVHCEPGSSGRLPTKTRKERKVMGFLLGIVSSSCRNRRAHDSAPFCL